jgi:hypothetical protein
MTTFEVLNKSFEQSKTNLVYYVVFGDNSNAWDLVGNNGLLQKVLFYCNDVDKLDVIVDIHYLELAIRGIKPYSKVMTNNAHLFRGLFNGFMGIDFNTNMVLIEMLPENNRDFVSALRHLNVNFSRKMFGNINFNAHINSIRNELKNLNMLLDYDYMMKELNFGRKLMAALTGYDKVHTKLAQQLYYQDVFQYMQRDDSNQWFVIKDMIDVLILSSTGFLGGEVDKCSILGVTEDTQDVIGALEYKSNLPKFIETKLYIIDQITKSPEYLEKSKNSVIFSNNEERINKLKEHFQLLYKTRDIVAKVLPPNHKDQKHNVEIKKQELLLKQQKLEEERRIKKSLETEMFKQQQEEENKKKLIESSNLKNNNKRNLESKGSSLSSKDRENLKKKIEVKRKILMSSEMSSSSSNSNSDCDTEDTIEFVGREIKLPKESSFIRLGLDKPLEVNPTIISDDMINNFQRSVKNLSDSDAIKQIFTDELAALELHQQLNGNDTIGVGKKIQGIEERASKSLNCGGNSNKISKIDLFSPSPNNQLEIKKISINRDEGEVKTLNKNDFSLQFPALLDDPRTKRILLTIDTILKDTSLKRKTMMDLYKMQCETGKSRDFKRSLKQLIELFEP